MPRRWGSASSAAGRSAELAGARAPVICLRRIRDKEDNIKALSIVRPGGRRIASGEKTLEVRRWNPNLAPFEDLLIVENGRYLHHDGDHDDDGVAVAIVKVRAVRPFTVADVAAACASSFEEGWLAWELTDVRPTQSTGRVLAARDIYEVDFPLLRDS